MTEIGKKELLRSRRSPPAKTAHVHKHELKFWWLFGYFLCPNCQTPPSPMFLNLSWMWNCGNRHCGPQGEDAMLYLKVRKSTNRQAFNHCDQHQGKLSPQRIFHFRQRMRMWIPVQDLSERPHLHPFTLAPDLLEPACLLRTLFLLWFSLPSFLILDLAAFSAPPWQIFSLFSAVIALQHVWPHTPSSLSVSSHYLSSVLSLFFPFNAVELWSDCMQ